MMNSATLIRQYSRMTGIRDPKIDTYFANQETYRLHGIQHPSLPKKKEPERRSRSPLLPGPRKIRNPQEEMFEKWMDENYPERLFPRYSVSDSYTLWGDSSWRVTEILGIDRWMPNWWQKGYKSTTYTTTYATNKEYEDALRKERHQELLDYAKELQESRFQKYFKREWIGQWDPIKGNSKDKKIPGAEA